jgi:hypothetical protein
MTRKSIYIALSVCLVIILVVSGSCSQAKIVTATLTQTATATVTVTELSAAQIVSQAGDNLSPVNSFHFRLDQVGGGTPIANGIEMTKVDGDIVKPDKLKASVTGTAMGMSIDVQMISVGGVIYMTNFLSGKWEVLPGQFAVLGVFDPNTGISQILRGINGPTRLADETAGGVACYHISGTVDSGSLNAITGSSVKGTVINVEVWIGKADFLPRIIKLTGKITDTEVPGIVRTLSLSNFNETVSIELPKQ